MTSPSERNGQGAPRGALPTRTREDIERGIGVDPVEQLHARRWDLVRANADLYARVQMWDARRKALKSLLLVEIHDSYEHGSRASEKKPAAPILEAMAYNDARYRGFLDRVEQDITEWKMAEDEIRSIDEMINRDQRLIGFATAEVSKHG